MGNCQDLNCKTPFQDQGNFNISEINIIEQIDKEFIIGPDNLRVYDTLYGEIDILQIRTPKVDFKMARKIYNFSDKSEYRKIVQFYEAKFYGSNHPNLLIIHAMQNKKIKEVFKNTYRISLFFDFPERTLAQEILYRTSIYFEETEILYFMDSLIGALAQLQSKGQSCGNLHPENIYLVKLLNGKLGIKIKNPLHTDDSNAFDQLMTFHLEDRPYSLEKFPFPSPEQCLILKNRKMEKYNQFKSEVFTLGLIILELGTRRKSIDLYSDFEIDSVALQENIARLNERFSEQIGIILNGMLQVDCKLRCDFLELDELLNSSSLKGKRIAHNWAQEEYQYCINSTPSRKPQVVNQLFSFANPEQRSQLGNQSRKEQSKLSIRQINSEVENPCESRASSMNREVQSPDMSHKQLFRKYDTELVSRKQSRVMQDQNQDYESSQKKQMMTQQFSFAAQAEVQQPSQISYISKKQPTSKISIQQIYSEIENPQESRSSSNNLVRDDNNQNQDNERRALFKKYETEEVSRAESRKTKKTEGHGIEIISDGLTYEGMFVNGKKHGYGQLINDENVIIYEGDFFEGKYHKSGILINEHPQLLKVTYNYRDFNDVSDFWAKYDGDFKMGLKHGYGILVLTNGERYKGMFFDNKVHGVGTFMKLDGTEVTGQWADNVLL